MKRPTVRILVVGLTGRMGQEIQRLAQENKKAYQVIAGIGRRSHKNTTVPVYNQFKKLPAGDIDVVVDFSLPETLKDVLAWCVAEKKPLICGTTGLSTAQKSELKKAAKKIPLLWAPNMSMGIAVLNEAIQNLKPLTGFEFQIEEAHHKWKKDRPSGTAAQLQETLEAKVAKAPSPVSIRGGGIFGIHRLWAMGEEEVLVFEHTALNRAVFARGALRAAGWIGGKPAGLYGMRDVLFGSRYNA